MRNPFLFLWSFKSENDNVKEDAFSINNRPNVLHKYMYFEQIKTLPFLNALHALIKYTRWKFFVTNDKNYFFFTLNDNVEVLKLLMANFPGFKSLHLSSIASAIVKLYAISIFSNPVLQFNARVSVVTYWTSNFALYNGTLYTEKKLLSLI